MLNVCITFDYELFLGKNNAPYSEILFLPTAKISRVLAQAGVTATFFADVCSVEAHKRLGDNVYGEVFCAQIKDLIANGFDVQLHVHTSWLNAELIAGNVVPSKRGYRIHDFGFGENGHADKIIADAKNSLVDICSSVKPDYKCIAFRAGGFAIQPENQLFKALVRNGIAIDSSVVPYVKSDSINSFDFTRVPHKLNWWIDPEKGLSFESVCSKQTIFEVPVATARPRLLHLLGKTREQISLPKHKVLGEYAKSEKTVKKQNFIKKQFHRFLGHRYISLDTRNYLIIMEDLEYIYRRYQLDKSDAYLSLICHPKLADESRVDNLKNLVGKIIENSDKFAITNFINIFNRMNSLLELGEE